mgnify:CR=1 FL=1|tara:strand:+ start:1165 stop:1515 length:351 start_codon:yes stop_codon:yes gene_type:complete
MNEDDEGEEIQIPNVLEIKTKLSFAERDVTEVMTISTAEGAFGNDEPVAKLKIIDGDGDVVAEATMPLMDWTMRLVTMLKSTYSESKGKKLDLESEFDFETELGVKSDNIHYIYKR